MAKGPRTVLPIPDGIVERVHVGTSGWSYPGWRPGFYPAGLQPSEFLGYYADRFPTVELNTTGYRLPAEDQFRRWAVQAPDGFSRRKEGESLGRVRVFRLGDSQPITSCERRNTAGDSPDEKRALPAVGRM